MNVALIGNPNSGKTSLFNKLTGLNQKIGNWPGVTISRKEGKIKDTGITLVDLPGIYSLSPYTNEEIVSREYLLNEKPDFVINVIDSTSFERSLFLTTQLLDLGLNVVLALNMSDLLSKKGITLDEKVLSKELGAQAVKVSAKTGQGVDELVKIVSSGKQIKKTKRPEMYSRFIESELMTLKKEKGLENDFLCLEEILSSKDNRSKQVIEKLFKIDAEQVVANEKYEFISDIRNKCFSVIERKETMSDKLDKVFLNRWLAIPIFLIVMTLVYVLSVGVVGGYFSEVLNKIFFRFETYIQTSLEKFGASKWAVSLVCDGLISGVCSVLTFVPELIVIFFCVSVLESTGYMSRISLMFDRVFRGFGLSGKSLVPFIIGTGCSVPAIASTKTIENSSEREMTAVVSPFVPCSAKLPIISLFVGNFFPKNQGLVTASLYFLAIAVIFLSCLILKRFFCDGTENSFISELPEYKTPNIKYSIRDVFDKTKGFILRVGTIIVFCSVLVWFLSSFDWRFRFCENIENSVLAWIGNLFGWFFYPIVGEWNWAVSISAIQGFVAKEQVVSSMSVIAGLEGNVGSIFSSGIFSKISKCGAYAFVMFNLFSAPCVSAIAAMKDELKSTKKMWIAVSFQIAIAWVLSSFAYLFGTFVLGGI